jgi:hypothetical protein
MHIVRFLRARRLVLCVSLLGFLALASGCGDSDPATSVGPDEAKNRGEAQQKAREAQYGPGGVPKGKPAAPPKTPESK